MPARFFRQAAGCLIVFCALRCFASAQSPAAAHAGHASDDSWANLPAPPLMSGIGSSSLKITTKSAQAQAYFSQGIELLHCFWDLEAYRAFKEASRLDPEAPMPYWGIVRSLGDKKSMAAERKSALEKIKAALPHASDHEQFYLRIAVTGEEKKGEEGGKEVRKQWEALVDKYPDDIDAALFLALNTMGGYDSKGRPEEGALYSQALLRNLIAEHPDNAAAHHYWIHAVEDSSRPERALYSADSLGRLAPASGHMVHMPGHIYYRVGDYDKARAAFLDSMRVDEAYMRDQKMTTREDWNYAHNLSYLVAACEESGRYHEALRYAQMLHALPVDRDMHSFYYVARPGSTLTRLQIAFEQWQAAADTPVEFGVPPDQVPPASRAFDDALRAFARGMLAVEKNNLTAAGQDADALDSHLFRLEVDH